MTETEWLASTEPMEMIGFAAHRTHNNRWHHHQVTDRKIRLLMVAYCREIWDKLPYECDRQAVITAEMYADDPEKYDDELRNIRCYTTSRLMGESDPKAYYLRWLPNVTIRIDANNIADILATQRTQIIPESIQAGLIRDMLGGIFFHKHSLYPCGSCGGKTTKWGVHRRFCSACDGTTDSEFLQYVTPLVSLLASAAYDDRDPATGRLKDDCLAVLADALQDAGCPSTKCEKCEGDGVIVTEGPNYYFESNCRYCGGSGKFGVGKKGRGYIDHPVVANLRSNGPHYRGMWGHDYVLGRE